MDSVTTGIGQQCLFFFTFIEPQIPEKAASITLHMVLDFNRDTLE